VLGVEDGGVSLLAADEHGGLVASVDCLVLREVSSEQLGRARGVLQESLYRLDWTPVGVESSVGGLLVGGCVVLGGAGGGLMAALGAAGVQAGVFEDLGLLGEAVDGGVVVPGVVLVDCTSVDTGDGGVLGLAHVGVHRVLGLLQAWLLDERFSSVPLVLVTRGAVAVWGGEGVPGFAQAPVWGLVRSAQSENPGRFVLVDLDESVASTRALGVALAADEPQLALREGAVFAARLARVSPVPEEVGGASGGRLSGFGSGGTVLITGGTGVLGGLLARHLVGVHGVDSVVLASRGGLGAEGAGELQRELESLGARVMIEACDVSDRGEVERLLGRVPGEFPLSAVVHAAGAIDDGVLGSLTSQRIDGVMGPKADGAWHLHELTAELDLQAFVMFSSAAGVLGGAGQGNYAAANVFLDALAAHRRAIGLPGISIAWGLWAQATGMTGQLEEADLTRMARSGVIALTTAEGLELFDAACETGEALAIPARLNAAALRAQARMGGAALLRGLIRLPSPRAMAGERGGLAERLRDVPESDRGGLVLELVRAEVAAVLGHVSSAAVDSQRAFKEMGFDSLTAVELRNRLNVVTGLQLTATLVFDYPTPERMADRLLEIVSGDGKETAAALDAELDRFELLFSSMAEGIERTRVMTRMQALLSSPSDAGESDDGDTAAEKLQSATAAEVMAFIDQELRSK
jgi:hypothetical protein